MSTMEKSNITLGGFIAGAAVGAIVGAGVALLFAPKTGKETREWLGTKTREVKGRVGIALDRTKEAVAREAKVLASTLETPRH